MYIAIGRDRPRPGETGGTWQAAGAPAKHRAVSRTCRLLPSCTPSRWGESGRPTATLEGSNAYKYAKARLRVLALCEKPLHVLFQPAHGLRHPLLPWVTHSSPPPTNF